MTWKIVSWKIPSFILGLSVILATGCGGGSDDGGQTPTPSPTPAADELAFVIATDFETGSFATVGLDDPRTVEPASPQRSVHSDAVVRVFGDRVYVVNRLFGDNVQILDPSNDFETILQCSTGNGSNPHDIAVVSEDKAYVTLADETDLLIVNPSANPDCSNFILGTIDLSTFADDDGFPEMDQMAVVENRLFVSLQKLDRNNFFAPAAPGSLVVVDTTTDTLVGDEIDLGANNPFGVTKGLTVSDGSLVIAFTGAFGVADGGIRRVDLDTLEVESFLITEEALGGDLTDFVLVSDDVGYAVISEEDFTNSVVAFDPGAGTVTSTLLVGSTFIADIELNERGELYVSDRDVDAPGVRVYDAADGELLTPQPLDVGLPPAEIVFVR